jgi:hypothetical protein
MNEFSSQPQPLTPKMNNFFRKHLAWVLTLFLTCIFWLHTCNLNRKLDEQANTITQIDLDRQQIKELSNRQGRQIIAQEAFMVTSKETLNRLTDSIFDLKKRDARNLETIAYYKGVTKFQVKEVGIPYLDSVRMRNLTDSVMATKESLIEYIENQTIEVPAPAALATPHYNVALTVTQDSLRLDSLSIPNTLQLRFVESGRGLFKKPQIEVQYFNSNTYITNLSSNSVFYQPKKKSFWTTVVLPVAIGVGAGILISK